MNSDARSEIIARVRHGSRGASAVDIAADLERLGPAPQVKIRPEELAGKFLENARKNQASAQQVESKSEAAKAVAEFLYQRHRSRKLVAGQDPRLAGMPWRDGGVLPRFGEASDGDLASVSYARLGVAETGSVVTWTGKANPASNNLLAEHHIVLLDFSDLVATLEQAWDIINASWGDGPRHRGVNFISAPSSTADIDLELVTGAHGPRSLHIILIGDAPTPASADD